MSSNSPADLPDIDCVIIGVNARATLGRCIESVLASDYPRELLHIIYVDGGSTDNSVEIGSSFKNVQVIQLTPEYPTPGLGRNAGWRAGRSPLVQFLDSDTEVAPEWFIKGVTALENGIGAVQGYRKEKFPDKSIYNWLGSLEWNGPPGEADSFGGDVLVQREALEQSGGYDEVLVGGEDPELSQRIRIEGWKILQLDTIMTFHDLAMTRFSQYWKRTYRSGYGFAAVVDRFSGESHNFWHVEFRRIIVRGGGFVVLFFTGLLLFLISLLFPLAALPGLAMIIIGSVLLFFPRLFRVKAFMRDKGLDRDKAKIYANHCSFVVIPDIFGVARYYLGKWFNRPLRNRRSKLATAAIRET